LKQAEATIREAEATLEEKQKAYEEELFLIVKSKLYKLN